ncbi:hypothetical protein [Dyella sp.]|uniref:hypothetical protein n=1 Tax=Dyella sp. TaxID=1869338 RepID=UPI002ED5429F
MIDNNRPGQGVFFARVHASIVFVRLMWLIAVMVTIAGCASTRTFVAPKPPGGGYALIYIIRDHYGMADREAKIYVLDTLVGTIANNDYIAVNAPMGVIPIWVKVSGDQMLDFALPISHENRIYVSLSSEDQPAGFSGKAVYTRRHLQAQVISHDAALAWAERAHKTIQ